MSDHGTNLGEHPVKDIPWRKKGTCYPQHTTMYDHDLHVAMMIKGKDLPQGKTWSINYPTDLNAQFIIAKTKKNWIRIATKYIPLHFTKISIFRSREGFKMLWELRPWSGYKNYGSPELLIEEFNSDNEAIKEYKMWMEKVFKLKKKEGNCFYGSGCIVGNLSSIQVSDISDRP